MSMMRIAIRAVTVTKVIVTTITALVSTVARKGTQSPTIPTLPAAASPELRRRGMRIPARPRPMGLIRPQYLPELTRARSLRLRVVPRPMATSVEVRSLSELRWRRFSRVHVTAIR